MALDKRWGLETCAERGCCIRSRSIGAWRLGRAQFYSPMSAGLLAFIIYLLTLKPDLTAAHHSGDGGELITAAVTLGVPHPPGYPTYTLLGKLITFLPVGTVAWRFHLFSAICTAIAMGIIVLVSQRLVSDHFDNQAVAAADLLTAPLKFSPFIAGILFAIAPLVWGQATVAEVYGLNLMMVSLVLWALLCRQASRSHSAALTGLFFGLALTTHLTSILLLPFVLLLTPPNKWQQFLGGGMIGTIPWLLLPYLSQTNSPVQWGNASTISGWWWLISAQIYRPNLFNLTLAEMGGRLWQWLPALGRQFGYLGWVPILAGWVSWWHKEKVIAGAILLSGGGYLIYALGFGTKDAGIFAMPALLLFTPLLAVGLTSLQSIKPWQLIAFTIILVVITFPRFWQAKNDTLRPQSTIILDQAPANAILVTSGNTQTTALWYFHDVEQLRPDILLVDDILFGFDWYRQWLQERYPFLQAVDIDDMPAFFAANSKIRPVCPITTQLILQDCKLPN